MQDASEKDGAKTKKKKQLDLVRWATAFQAYALAAEAAEAHHMIA